MANFQVIDAYGSVITIQSSTFGTEQRQMVGASIIGAVPVNGTIGASIIGLPPINPQYFRNDTLATQGADTSAGFVTRDSASRTVIKPYADDSITFRYNGSVVSGSVTLIQSSTAGKRSYVTDVIASNSGSVFTLITLKDGSTSVVGYIPAPATSGAIPQFTILPRTAVAQDLTFTVSPSVSVLSLTVNGYQA